MLNSAMVAVAAMVIKMACSEKKNNELFLWKGVFFMNRTISRVLWIIAGVLLILAGICCLCNPDVGLLTLSLYIGVAMLISGIIDIAIFAKWNGQMLGAGWFLADGILTVLLSLFLLFNQAFTMLSLPFIFGMWLLFSGINQFVNSFELETLGIKGWGWMTALGVLLAVVGFFSLFDPIANLFALGILVGILLICEGVAAIVRACLSHRFWR